MGFGRCTSLGSEVVSLTCPFFCGFVGQPCGLAFNFPNFVGSSWHLRVSTLALFAIDGIHLFM